MSLTKVSYSMINGEAVNVLDYGADNTGATDTTAKIQAAIDTGKSVYFPAGTYLVTSLTIQNKTEVSYFANNDVTITNDGVGTGSALMMQLVGTISNIEFNGLKFVGDGSTNAYNGAIGCSSNQTIDTVLFNDLWIENVRLGLALNADLGGSFTNSVVDSCYFKNIVGETPSAGYGIICPNAFYTTITNCTFENVGRHDVYVGRGGYVNVSNCYFKDHRKDTHTNNPRGAVQISRTAAFVNVTNCIFTNFYDGAVQISHGSGEPQDCRYINIEGCQFENALDAVPTIFIGLQEEPTTPITRNINIIGNQFYSSYTTGGPSISVANGQQILIKDNQFKMDGIAGTAVVINVGSSSYSANANSVKYVTIVDNQFRISGSTGSVYLTNLAGYVGANIDNSIWIDTKFYKYDVGLTPVVWGSADSGFVNEGVQGAVGRSDRTSITYWTAAPTTGTWQRGDIVWNILPSAGGYVGWICTTAGTPGTWKTFGAITA